MIERRRLARQLTLRKYQTRHAQLRQRVRQIDEKLNTWGELFVDEEPI